MAHQRLLRNPLPNPPGGDDGKDIIAFHHPGYAPRRSRMFTLPRVDRTANTDTRLGIYHDTALQACRIVAGNACDGQLCLDRKGQEPAGVGLSDVLVADKYYFVRDDGNTPGIPYPVVPSFGEWTFPHDGVPEAWSLPSYANLGTPGTRCVMTRQSVGLKTAHIVHKGDWNWFQDQAMGIYTAGKGINAVQNLVKLRADLHKLYDSHGFVFLPKQEVHSHGDGGNPPTYVLHVLGQGVGEVWSAFHNVPLQGIEHTQGALHFARFARAILQGVKEFITQGHPRQVMRVDALGEPRTEYLSGDELKSHYGGGGSMEATPLHPRKRRRAEPSQGGDVEDEEDGFLSTQTEGDHEEAGI